ncbi:MAG: hypothetical protein ACE15B_09135 [Bryobacteraceae bacterium]
MSFVFSGLLYFSGIFFLAACAVRAARYARAPLHLRWEIYPVPARHSLDEARVMGAEMLFLKGLWEFNRKLWLRSLLFHWGLYLTAATMPLLWIGYRPLYLATGIVGCVFVIGGASALLAGRLTDPKLRVYNTPADLFNLVFFIAVFALLAAGYYVEGVHVRAMAASLLRFHAVVVPPLFGAGLALGALLAAYIPCTHMAHFIAKYFTYHAVRWDERAMTEGGLARRFAEYLTYRPTWAARHVGADGSKTWVDIATSNPAAGGKQ